MATPLSAAALLAALKAEGVRVVEVDDWRTHNRNHVGPWGSIHGSIVHHTVTKGTDTTVRICRDGFTGLPGPLCHGVIAKSGTVYLVGYGRANHAGGGDPAVLAAVRDESYGTRPPAPTKGNADGVDGNRHYYGWECENLGDGKDPWPEAQYQAIIRVNAALIRAHRAKGDDWGLLAKSVIGHAEWSDDKSDPRGISMITVRADVAERLKHPASWSPGDTTQKPPEEEPEMSLTVEQASQLAQLHAERRVAPWQYKNADIETRDAYGILRDTNAEIDDVKALVVALSAKVSELEITGLTEAQLNAIADRVVDALHTRLAE